VVFFLWFSERSCHVHLCCLLYVARVGSANALVTFMCVYFGVDS
jgi:hypothetical protein